MDNIEKELKSIKIKELRKLAKQLGIKKTSKLNKLKLIEEIKNTKQGGFITGFLSNIGKLSKSLYKSKPVQKVKETISKLPFAKNILDFFDFRRNFKKGTQSVLNQYGEIQIKEMRVFRCPIKDILKSMLNVLSFGTFNELMRKYGFDKLFHLGLLITLENGVRLVVEKNEEINVSTSLPPLKEGCETTPVILTKIFTINQILMNTKEKIGDEMFYDYDATNNNCQFFIMNILKSNGLLTSHLKEFIYQNLTELFNELDDKASYMRGIMKATTRTGKIFNVLTGNGNTELREMKIKYNFEDYKGGNIELLQDIEQFVDNILRERENNEIDDIGLENTINQIYLLVERRYRNRLRNMDRNFIADVNDLIREKVRNWYNNILQGGVKSIINNIIKNKKKY